MRIKTKGIIKKIALVLAGVVALSAVGFGVAKLVEFVKDDLKTISPVFDVGNLGTDGKFVDDESTLYTKEAFACDGLQIKLDFDNQIEYQIYFYDDLDNFVESTEVLSAAYSDTVHDGYARIVIMPTNDEDEKISLTERVTYPGQMTIKVAKEQTSEYVAVYNRRLKIVDDLLVVRFTIGNFGKDPSLGWHFYSSDESKHSVNSMDLVSVQGGSTVTLDIEIEEVAFFVYEFKEINGVITCIKENQGTFSYALLEDTEYVVMVVNDYSSESRLDDEFNSELPQHIKITK